MATGGAWIFYFADAPHAGPFVQAWGLVNDILQSVTGEASFCRWHVLGTELALNGAVAHAFNEVLFKGLLFMSMGAVLLRVGHVLGSDLGGLYKSMPLTTVFCIVGAASISAFPLFSGFVSKSMIMAAMIEHGSYWLWLALLFASAGVFHHAGIKVQDRGKLLDGFIFTGEQPGAKADTIQQRIHRQRLSVAVIDRPTGGGSFACGGIAGIADAVDLHRDTRVRRRLKENQPHNQYDAGKAHHADHKREPPAQHLLLMAGRRVDSSPINLLHLLPFLL